MSCFGFGRGDHVADEERGERQPLLSHYDDDTELQRQLHRKLHTYQIFRALSSGYMPSTDQAIVNLRTLLSAEVLNPRNEEISDSGRALALYLRDGITQLIEFLRQKNGNDQIQDLIWYMSKARFTVDVDHVAERLSKAKAKSNTIAAYQSLRTVVSLLLANSDVRLLVSDLSVLGREVFSDSALALSKVSKEAAERAEPSREEQELLKKPGDDETINLVTDQQRNSVAGIIAEGTAEVARTAEHSIVDKLQGDEKDTLLYRLKHAVTNLRRRQDYTQSVSSVSVLIRQYILTYFRAVDEVAEAVREDIGHNREADRAVQNFYQLISTFGDEGEWRELENCFNKVVRSSRNDPHFSDVVDHIGSFVNEMFTDPTFFDNATERFRKLQANIRELTAESSVRDDIDGLLERAQSTLKSVLQDHHVANLISTSKKLFKVIFPGQQYNSELLTDAINFFIPQIIQLVQYLPIPRLEIATPQIDLLLENLIMEPGVTINGSSFLPYKLRFETYNDVEVRKARFRTVSAVRTMVRIKLQGISIRADEVGFWMRAHSGLLRLIDEGIVSFHLDERGIDIELDVEVGKDRLEKVLSLENVHVRIHKLDWTLRKSKFAFFAWLLKPFLRPVLRKALEVQIAAGIANTLHAVNRELVYARERLRATRISNPDSVLTFFKAVSARLALPDDPDLYARIGIAQPGEGVFEGVYAPGSVVKMWNEEAAQAKQRIRENERDGWRNSIFNVHASMLT